METTANEGGIGGKFRRRPFRRAQATPYDRPSTALRGGRGGGHVEERGGWMKIIVDPASRLIASGASKLFESVFRKRLTAPPVVSEDHLQFRQAETQITGNVSSSEIQKGDRDGDYQTNNTGTTGIAELEQLLKQKTFTRDQFDHLADLLRSRMVETSNAELNTNNEKNEKTSVRLPDDGIEGSRVLGSLSVASGLSMQKQISKDEPASPAELAKAYMGTRPSNVSPPVGSFRNQVFQEDANFTATASTSKRLDLSVAPRSVIRFSGVPVHPEDGYQAKKPGRSAIYRMSRSPYFKVNSTVNSQVGELSRESQWTPSAMKSGGRQVLKRGISSLDGDSGSLGPIRRIRQRFDSLSPSKVAPSPTSGNFLTGPSNLNEDVFKDSMAVQKSTLLNNKKYDSTGSQASENGISDAGMLSPQLRESAQKLFQQLDKLYPSPGERSPGLKNSAKGRSATSSMDDFNSSRFSNIQGNGKLDTSSHSTLQNIRSSQAQNLAMVKENGASKSVGLKVNSTSEGNGISNDLTPSKDSKPSVQSTDITIGRSVAFPKKTGFQMSAPEDILELDDDDDDLRDLSSTLMAAKDGAGMTMSKRIDVISETANTENSPTPSSQSISVASSTLFKKADKKGPIMPVMGKNNGFAFPVGSDSGSLSQQPPTPTMPTPGAETADLSKKQTSPVFNFGSGIANSTILPTTTGSLNDKEGLQCGQGRGSEPSFSSSNATVTSPEMPAFHKTESEKAGDVFKSAGNTVSTGISTLSAPCVFKFGMSNAPTQSNGSLHISPVLGAASVTLSKDPVSTISVDSTSTKSSYSSLSVSSAVASLSTASPFQFASSISIAAPVLVSQPSDKSDSAILETNPAKALPFGISNSTAQGTSSVFLNSSSSSSNGATSSTIFSSGSSSPTLQSSSVTSSSVLSFSSPNTAGFSSSVAVPSASPSTGMSGSSVFGSGASTQSTSSNPLFASVSSQNPTAVLGVTSGSTSSSSLFANNSSQNSTAGESVFGSRSTQPGMTSQMAQSSMSQFGSLVSSPFGLGNSSSSSFGVSPFAPATSGAKPFTSGSVLSISAGFGSSSSTSSSPFAPVATNSLFGTSSPVPASIFASSTSSIGSQPMGFSLGASGPSSSPFNFGSSSGSIFSFTSAGTAASSSSSAVAPLFGMLSSPVGFGSSSPGNDQMNEDSMTDDTNQVATPSVSTFGQPANASPSPGYVFGSQPVQPGSVPFQFGSHQNSSVPQNPSPFQSAGNVEFTPVGSFSLGSGAGDKSTRKFVKVRRDKGRKR